MEIPATHYAASRAASVAENCINYQQGTPHKVFQVQTVQQASKEVSPEPQLGSACFPPLYGRGSASQTRIPPGSHGQSPKPFASTVPQRTPVANPCRHRFCRHKISLSRGETRSREEVFSTAWKLSLFLNRLAVLANRQLPKLSRQLFSPYPKGNREKQAPCKRTKAVWAVARLWPPTSCLR